MNRHGSPRVQRAARISARGASRIACSLGRSVQEGTRDARLESGPARDDLRATGLRGSATGPLNVAGKTATGRSMRQPGARVRGCSRLGGEWSPALPALRVIALGLLALGPFAMGLAGCGTVDLGDNFIAPDLLLDEDYFYCRIQPQVLDARSCASGGMGENGSCHSARSSLRLFDTSGVAPVTCQDDRVVGAIPDVYSRNFDAIQFTIQSDYLSSPFYRRPVGLDSHPRTIFAETDPDAQLIRDWIQQGAL